MNCIKIMTQSRHIIIGSDIYIGILKNDNTTIVASSLGVDDGFIILGEYSTREKAERIMKEIFNCNDKN